jgi:hypothetical protein
MAKEVNINDWNRDWFQEMAQVIDIHKPVHVYRNLHKHCWSVRQDGKVKVHTSYILLQDVNFVVQPAGREKVLKEQRKNVHAYVKGYLISANTCNRLTHDVEWTPDAITYNPYKHPHFTCRDAEVVHAQLVDMDSDALYDKVYGYGIKTKELV